MNPVRLLPSAEEEAADAAEWYEARRPGLGARFLDSLAAAMAQLARLPDSGAVFFTLKDGRPVRRILLSGFPYALCYERSESSIIVLAVAHTRRRPGYWLARTRRRRSAR